MKTAEFSEFSYGYALTDNIVHGGFPATGGAPVFPSLFAEGSAGGGYDVKIPLHPVPIFLQFKIPQVVGRRSFKMPAGFTKPYLRMPLRTREPNQHKLLLDLESGGNIVAYATPNFWETSQLDVHYGAQRVPHRTSYFTPSSIGPFDEGSHHVAYCPGHVDAWVRSEPRKLEGRVDAESFGVRIGRAVNIAQRREPLNFLNALLEKISRLIDGKRSQSIYRDPKEYRVARREPASREEINLAARTVGYLAQVHLGCSFFVVGRNE